MKHTLKLFLVLVIACLVAAGCSGEQDNGAAEPDNTGGSSNGSANESGGEDVGGVPEGDVEEEDPGYTGGPVELLVQDRNTALTQEEFEEYFARPVKEKYPDISMRLTEERSIETLITAGTIPDMAAISNTVINEYLDLGYAEDLSEAIKQYNIDLERIEPSIVSALEGLGRGEGIHGLPFGMNYGSLFYKTDIFDRFGVAYPDDVITWDEYYELTKALTRLDGDTQYRGGTLSTVNILRQRGVSNFDENDEKAVLQTDGHQEIFTFISQFFDLPGYVSDNKAMPTNPSDQTLAMYPLWITTVANTGANDPPYEWDVAAYPVFADRPEYGNIVDFHMLTVSSQSEHKDAAYRVLELMLTDEFQMELTKHKRISPLVDRTIKEMYAEDSGVFEGKNLQSIFKVGVAPLPDYSRWKQVTDKFITQVSSAIALEGKDINTALRESEELANAAIAEVKDN